MIQFPSDTGRDGQGHVGGSQEAADELVAKNMREQVEQAERGLNPIVVGFCILMLLFVLVAAVSAFATIGAEAMR